MGIGNILILCQMTSYVLCCIFSFFIFAPMAVNKNSDFDGNCLLFATGQIDTSGTTSRVVINSWGSPGSCNFAIAVGVFVMLLSILQIVRLSFHVFYETDSSFIGAFGTFVTNVIMIIMLFASAINVAQGYNAWCNIINATDRCSVAGFQSGLWKDLPNIKADNYNVELGMVQFGLWAELLLWAFVCLFSVVKLVKYHQQESIVRSLSRERERLIGRYNQPDF